MCTSIIHQPGGFFNRFPYFISKSSILTKKASRATKKDTLQSKQAINAAKKAEKPLQIGSLIFLAGYILAKNIAPQEIHIDNYLTQTIVYTLAAFSLWNVVDLFIENVRPRAIYRRSFAVYAMHLNIAIILLKVFSVCLPENPWLEIPKFAVMVILTLAIINLVCAFLEKFTPKIYGILMGNRAKSQQKLK